MTVKTRSRLPIVLEVKARFRRPTEGTITQKRIKTTVTHGRSQQSASVKQCISEWIKGISA